MNPAGDADRATRRAQVIESLADAVATLDRAPPIHVAVDGLTDPTTRALADDLARVLSDRGRRCRRVTLDTLSLLHPAGPGVARPLGRTGWWLDRYDDGPDRFIASAERVPGPIR
jgi:hypothetical protein